MIAILLTTVTLSILVFYLKIKVVKQNTALIKGNTGDSLLYWFTTDDIKKVSNPNEKWVLRFNNLANTLLLFFTLIFMVSFAIVLLSLT